MLPCCKITLLPLHLLLFGRKSLCIVQTHGMGVMHLLFSGEEDLCNSYINCLEFFSKGNLTTILSSLHICIQSFICISIYSWIFIYFVQTFPSLADATADYYYVSWHIPIILSFEHFLTFCNYKMLQTHIVYSMP
jgi:hypothetical protein